MHYRLYCNFQCLNLSSYFEPFIHSILIPGWGGIWVRSQMMQSVFAGVSACATAKHETQGGSKPLSSLNTVNEAFLINIS